MNKRIKRLTKKLHGFGQFIHAQGKTSLSNLKFKLSQFWRHIVCFFLMFFSHVFFSCSIKSFFKF